MAKKSISKKSATKKQHTPDYYPVSRQIPVGVFGSAITPGDNVGDAGKLLSIYNRRLYRYGMRYQIKIDLDVDQGIAVPYEVEVYALNDNWDVQRAFALAKATYDAAYADELTKSGVAPARWRDFRVFHGLASANELDPVRYDGTNLAAVVTNEGEHNISSVDIGGTDTEFSWRAVGGRLGILAEWQHAGRTSADPASKSANAPYDGVNADDMSDIEYDRLQNDGDIPPYSQTSSGDMFVKIGTLRVDPVSGAQRLSTGYFDAPCGLFVLKNTQPGNLPNGLITMTAKAGDHKGISAQKMCQ